jgi:hypothetical protein
MIRKWKTLEWDIIIFTLLAVISVWGIAIMRGGSGELLHLGLVPWARYAFPAILPTAILLCLGWYEILRWVTVFFRLSHERIPELFLAFMLSLNGLALVSIADYFYLEPGQAYAILFLVILVAFWGFIIKLGVSRPHNT